MQDVLQPGSSLPQIPNPPLGLLSGRAQNVVTGPQTLPAHPGELVSSSFGATEQAKSKDSFPPLCLALTVRV